MRADRLVSLVLLLRQRGRMTAAELATELEVSARTVLRDIDALSTAGVPVYAERGRYGGFALLPGFRTELTGLNHEEALALLTAGSGPGGNVFGLSAALASAMRKVLDALPPGHLAHVDDATRRFLVEPDTDLLSRSTISEDIPAAVMGPVRQAVLAGHRLRFGYTAPGEESRSRTVDPLGLVTVRGHSYLLATRAGEDRTYRLSRMTSAEELPERAQRPDRVDVDQLWRERRARFLSEHHLSVRVVIRRSRRGELLDLVRSVHEEWDEAVEWVRLDVAFDDLRHATWALWQLGPDAEAIAPEEVRTALRDRATALAAQYARAET